MQFNAQNKAAHVAALQAVLDQAQNLEPTPDTNPLQEQLDIALGRVDTLTQQVTALSQELESVNSALQAANDKLDAGRTAAQATVAALAD